MNQFVDVAIGLGGNLGDRLENLTAAAKRLAEEFLSQARASRVYESPPWGITTQPDFLNAVVVGRTEWKPPAIINYLKTLERELGRQPDVRNGPRLIDLDLLAWGGQTWKTDGVEVPHPRMQDRDFVLLPLAELWPEWKHPTLGRTILQMCAALGEPSAQLIAAKL